MAEVKTVELKITTNIPDASKKVNELKESLKGVKTEAGSLNEEVAKSSKLGEVFGQLKQGAESLIPGLKGAEGAASGLGKQFLALVANPIGLIITGIVVGLKFLYEAFQSSIAGGKELKAIFAAVEGVGNQVKDAIFGLGRALINVTAAAYKFITLDFKGAAESMKKANKEASTSFGQLGNAIDGTTAKIIYNLTKQQQAVDKARKQQAVVQSETNKLLVQSREILTDETASINEKKKALAEVTKAEKASSAEKVRIAAEDLRIAKERAKALGGEAEKKSKQELRELTIALNEAETENAMTGIKLNKQRKMLNRQETADAKAAADERIAKRKEEAEARKVLDKEQEERDAAKNKLQRDQSEKARQDLEDIEKLDREIKKKNLDSTKTDNQLKVEAENAEYERKKALLISANLSTEALDKLHKENLNKLELEYFAKESDNAVARTKTEAENTAARKKLAEEEYAFKIGQAREASAVMGQLSELAGKDTIAGKALGIASATVNTYVGVTEALKQKSTLPSPFDVVAKVANVATVLATGFKAVKAITAVKIPGGGGGGAAPTPISVSGGAVASAPSFNVVGTSGQNQIAQSLGNQAPVKAYVVSNDVTTAQSLDRNIVKTATIGN
jgi:hypothetical protein